ncbi:hypothetical protein P344_06885 [Spiroplasma mirum ATCC 29335]|uniref:Uncharacterized protein n=1 Tax=Spiroplasma mirum ATCC 29335 TaxID=838561 RepID=W0GQZ6_9MOLU|nr:MULTISPECIES: hypothetical protein [Spiroplasma]AHF61523.1 hypothetical protein SMM_1156 [Spiroplasma mirum ATCC 29335]AHI58675.1 hypothetical protein P344_06885 [Spiroplasma mirum ATCC 29335]AKM53562.1 hypothetical protein SATRI_v1c12270 [Spiroplasma atrichopogonis]
MFNWWKKRTEVEIAKQKRRLKFYKKKSYFRWFFCFLFNITFKKYEQEFENEEQQSAQESDNVANPQPENSNEEPLNFEHQQQQTREKIEEVKKLMATAKNLMQENNQKFPQVIALKLLMKNFINLSNHSYLLEKDGKPKYEAITKHKQETLAYFKEIEKKLDNISRNDINPIFLESIAKVNKFYDLFLEKVEYKARTISESLLKQLTRASDPDYYNKLLVEIKGLQVLNASQIFEIIDNCSYNDLAVNLNLRVIRESEPIARLREIVNPSLSLSQPEPQPSTNLSKTRTLEKADSLVKKKLKNLEKTEENKAKQTSVKSDQITRS